MAVGPEDLHRIPVDQLRDTVDVVGIAVTQNDRPQAADALITQEGLDDALSHVGLIERTGID